MDTGPISPASGHLSVNDDIERKLKIACAAPCLFGHFNPMCHVAKALSQKGHEVHFITNGNPAIK